MSTDRKHSRELVRQLRAKALRVKRERGESDVLSGSAASRTEGRITSPSRSFVGSSAVQQRKDTTAR